MTLADITSVHPQGSSLVKCPCFSEETMLPIGLGRGGHCGRAALATMTVRYPPTEAVASTQSGPRATIRLIFGQRALSLQFELVDLGVQAITSWRP